MFVDVAHILPWLALALQSKFSSQWYVKRESSNYDDLQPNGVSFRALRLVPDIATIDGQTRGRLDFEVRISPSGDDNNLGMRYATDVLGWLRQAQFDIPEAVIDTYNSNYPVQLPKTIGYLPVVCSDGVPFRNDNDRELWSIECSCDYWYVTDEVTPSPEETTLTHTIVIDVNGTEITVD